MRKGRVKSEEINKEKNGGWGGKSLEKKHFWKNHTLSDGKEFLNGNNPTSVIIIPSNAFPTSGILLYLIDSI